MSGIRIGLAGVGKIAREQHIPVLQANPDFSLAACAGAPAPDGIPNYPDLDAMLKAVPDLDAVVIATPTQTHYACARAALMAGKHVLLEKPPCATLSEWHHLLDISRTTRCTLFQSWHLRGAPLVARVHDWLRGRKILGGRVVWKEDMNVTHPKQSWVWQPGGYGVLDAGINALSILTAVMPEPFFVSTGDLYFPEGLCSPVSAEVKFRCDGGGEFSATMDFVHEGAPVWDVELETDGGRMLLTDAATSFSVDGQMLEKLDAPDNMHVEYSALYRDFARLIRIGASDADVTPLRMIADIYMLSRHHRIAAI